MPGSLSYPIVTGKAKNSLDVLVPERLHEKFLRSPQGQARAKSIGATEAKALPGVVDAVLWDEPVMKAIPSRGEPLDNIAGRKDAEVGATVAAE